MSCRAVRAPNVETLNELSTVLRDPDFYPEAEKKVPAIRKKLPRQEMAPLRAFCAYGQRKMRSA
jgi:hypothetical protein